MFNEVGVVVEVYRVTTFLFFGVGIVTLIS